MALEPNEIAALHIASTDEEGRMVTFDPNDEPLGVIGGPDGHLSLGITGLRRLLSGGYIRFGGGSSYLLTDAGWKKVGGKPYSKAVLPID